jgi:hypothetical protein
LDWGAAISASRNEHGEQRTKRQKNWCYAQAIHEAPDLPGDFRTT